ncbi:MAG TPA: hypothetical protein VNV14_01445 [Opitutaceae bacterium]|jgi:hypothetical protein|nr:hypothetical protein [Opitutaceae bacterium]
MACLRCPLDAKADPVARLDVSVLQDNQAGRFCRWHLRPGRAREACQHRWQRGSFDASVTLAQLMDIADFGQIMPPKKYLARTQATFRTLCVYALRRLDALFIFFVDAVSEQQKAMTGRAELAYLSNPYRKLLEHIMQYYTILTALAGTMLVGLGCLP